MKTALSDKAKPVIAIEVGIRCDFATLASWPEANVRALLVGIGKVVAADAEGRVKLTPTPSPKESAP